MKTTRGETKLVDDQWMQESGEVGARRHQNAGEGLLDGASAADPRTAFQNQHTFSCTRQVGRAGEPIVSGAYDDGIP